MVWNTFNEDNYLLYGDGREWDLDIILHDNLPVRVVIAILNISSYSVTYILALQQICVVHDSPVLYCVTTSPQFLVMALSCEDFLL